MVLRGKQHKLTNGFKMKLAENRSQKRCFITFYSGLFYLHTVTFVMLNLSNCPFFYVEFERLKKQIVISCIKL